MSLPESNAIIVRDLSVQYADNPVLQGINLEIAKGCVTGIMGPNGSGKTTLIKCFIRQLPFKTGQVCLFGRDIARLNLKDIARQVGVVPQKWQSDFGFTARDFVGLGRYPHTQCFASLSPDDHAIIDHAMLTTSTHELARRSVAELSGGEMQRVVIAQALAQKPALLLLDEPTSSLDISHQIEICELMRELALVHGITVVMVLHDLNLAAQFCDNLVFLKDGRIFAQGNTATVFTSQNLNTLYGNSLHVVQNVFNGKPYVMFNPYDSSRTFNGSSPPSFRVHLIGGGGTITELMLRLHSQGYALSAGVLNILDTDWTTANQLGIPMAEEAPFSPIGAISRDINLKLIQNADLIILGNIPFGEGNLPNLEAAKTALSMGKQVWICEFSTLEKRDFTQGVAISIYHGLKDNGAVIYHEMPHLLSQLNQKSLPS